jgi:hypothetical protein
MDTPIIKMVLNKKTHSITTYYKGEKLDSISAAFYKIKDPKHAKLYMAEYRKLSKHADANVGYITGYYGQKEMRELQERFGVAHPIFGTSVPSAKKAFKAGLAAGKKLKKRGKA